uniref:RNA-dependent RNA polymerase n=1 Tax=Setaria viridis TaxID=4556 RepID=A0A4U6WGW0_SETVI|nr:hypothetical protein SEVIR_1G318000v2 [Setaria viridis]
MKSIQFCLFYNLKNYKLEIFYDSIWEMQLHRPPAHRSRTKFLLIQLQVVPKIYESLPLCSGIICHNCAISQTLVTTFFFYKEFNLDFECRNGYSYSCGTGIVPLVKSPNNLDAPFEILFKINNLVQLGTLSGPMLDDNFYRHVSPKFAPINHIKCALLNMLYLKSTFLNATGWLSAEYSKICKLHYTPQRSPQISPDGGLVYVHGVQVTPAKVYFYGPEINVSNHSFLRISFIDEDCEKLRSADLSLRSASRNCGRRTALYNRVLSVLSNGISIGDKHFEFLAFSSSQLRDNSAWMFASRQGLTASDIRKRMGDFRNIRNVAKYAARRGQSFSSSTETLKVHKYEVEEIPDIANGTKYIFSDGCKMKCFAPSVFQIRYAGYKGVVAVDPRSNRKLSLRKSMLKFQSKNITLDVLAYSKYQPCFLNQQLITLLSTLGVGDSFFESKQEEAVRQLNRMVTEPQAAIEAIKVIPMGEVTNMVKELLLCGYQPDHEPYLSMLLQTFRASKLLELKTKSRIFIPQGRTMMGCLDETRTLKYGHVFIQASYCADDRHKFVVTGMVVVAKILVSTPVTYEPHPNECSGSDLDGDIYFVSWDQTLIPSRMVEPMDYTQQPAETLDHDVTIKEIQEYFTNYIVNESLGIIANAHVVFADKEHLKAESLPCIELAKLFSIAVDFPKTGVPVQIPHELHVREYPDFMEKPDKATYGPVCLKGVIGKLYREIKKHTPHVKYFTMDVARWSSDSDLIVDGYEDYITEAIEFKQEYDFKLGYLMDHYGIKSEAEIMSGCILKMARNFTKSCDADAIRMAVRSLRKETMSWFSEMAMDENGVGQDDLDAKASAWYHVTYHPEYWGCYNEGYARDRPHLISFPWCVYDRLVNIKQRRNLKRKMVLK